MLSLNKMLDILNVRSASEKPKLKSHRLKDIHKQQSQDDITELQATLPGKLKFKNEYLFNQKT